MQVHAGAAPGAVAAAARTFDADGYCRRAVAFAFTGDASAVLDCGHAGGSGGSGGRTGDPGCGQCSGPLLVLLVGSSSKAGTFILPGGGIDAGEGSQAAALREAHEESGAVAAPAGRHACSRGCCDPPIWPLATVTNHAKCTRSRLFAVRVGGLASAYEDAGQRARMWASLPQAAALLAAQPAQQAYLRAALAALGWAVPGADAAVSNGCGDAASRIDIGPLSEPLD